MKSCKKHSLGPGKECAGFGYQPTKSDEGLELKLENMSAGATQVVLLEFEEELNSSLEIKVRFKDASNGEKQTLTKTVDVWNADTDKTADQGDFRKNLAIAILAQGLSDAAKRSHDGEGVKQVNKKAMKKSLRCAKELFPQQENDADFARVAKIAKQFNDDL